jgi:hypothetical protein
MKHQSVRLGDRFVCAICLCRWPCLVKATEIKWEALKK